MGTRHEELLERLRELLGAAATGAGLELVELTLKGSGKRRVLRVDIDRAGPSGVDLDDCQHLSHVLGEALEGAEVLRDSYVLEVSSPGLDRPIRSADDYRRNTGRRIMVTTREPIKGRRHFRGVLLGLVDGRVELRDERDQEVAIDADDIESVRQEVGLRGA